MKKSQKFSIEDAFEEDADDAIRLYGATSERSPLRPLNHPNNDIEITVKDPIGENRNTHYIPIPTDADSVSRDSDSLIPDSDNNSYTRNSYSSWCWFHPKVREKWRIVAGAFTLFILGSVLIIAGIVIEVVPFESLSGFVFLIAGFICFIPGIYHVVFIIFALQGSAYFAGSLGIFQNCV